MLNTSRTAFRFGFNSVTPTVHAASSASRRSSARAAPPLAPAVVTGKLAEPAGTDSMLIPSRVGGGVGEQPVEPAARHHGRVRVGRGAILGAGLARRSGGASNSSGKRLPAIPSAALYSASAPSAPAHLDCRRDVSAESDLAAKLGALAILGIALECRRRHRPRRPRAVRLPRSGRRRSAARNCRSRSGVPSSMVSSSDRCSSVSVSTRESSAILPRSFDWRVREVRGAGFVPWSWCLLDRNSDMAGSTLRYSATRFPSSPLIRPQARAIRDPRRSSCGRAARHSPRRVLAM